MNLIAKLIADANASVAPAPIPPKILSTWREYDIRELDFPEGVTPQSELVFILENRCGQHPIDQRVIPDDDQVCLFLYDIIAFNEWRNKPKGKIGVSPSITKSPEDLQAFLLEEANAAVDIKHLPQKGYQVDFYLNLFKQIKGPK